MVELAKYNMKLQKRDGSFSGGNNGPYRDPETPVRNSSHWLLTYSKCYEITGNIEFKNIVVNIAEFLSTNKIRPYNYSFYHRNKTGKDKCNGLIGQAWTFEALAKATEIIKDDKYLTIAKEVFSLHKFKSNQRLWFRLEINGESNRLDGTFNHQLWFAATSSLIGSVEINKRIIKFMDNLINNINVAESGLIIHHLKNSNNGQLTEQIKKTIKNRQYGKIIKGTIKKILYKSNIKDRKNLIIKSIGYHVFNLYAFALLKQQIPEHNFWKSELLNRTVNYVLTPEYKEGLEGNIYGYSYNPPGFEIPYALSLLSNLGDEKVIKISSQWVNEQIRRCYNAETKMMDRNTFDPYTHTARIYEITRLPSWLLENISIDL